LHFAHSLQHGPLFHFFAWAVPADAAPYATMAFTLVELTGLIVLFLSMQATARVGYGVGPFAVAIVVFVPITLFFLSDYAMALVTADWFPPPPVPTAPPVP